MLEKLQQLAKEVAVLHSKLILVIGPPRAGKTALLAAFAKDVGVEPLNVGSELGSRLATLPQKQRHLQAGSLFSDLADTHRSGNLLLVDNLELLFDKSLQLNPLDLLKRYANGCRVVAVWPGELRDSGPERRLSYAQLGHPEQRDYSTAGYVSLDIQQR